MAIICASICYDLVRENWMRYIIIKSKGTIFKSLNDQGRKRYIKYTQTCKKVCLVLATTPVLVPKRIDLFSVL